MESFINQGFVTVFPGVPGWVSQFLGDTWIGGFRMPTIEYGPNPWSLSLYRFDPNGSNLFPIDQCDCFAVLHGNTFVMGVPSHQLASTVGDYDINEMRFGFHLHYHDSTFGAPADSSSYVTTYPEVPGSRTYDDFLEPMTDWLIVVGTTTASETTSETTTTVEATITTEGSSSAASTAPVTAGGSTTSDDEISTDFPWWVLIVIGLIILAIGFWLWGWPRLFGGGSGETSNGGDEEDDDEDDDPRDTQPLTIYGEVIERLQCDWAVYFDDKHQGLVPLRKPLGGMECCEYVIRVSTDIILHEQAARGRQNAETIGCGCPTSTMRGTWWTFPLMVWHAASRLDVRTRCMATAIRLTNRFSHPSRSICNVSRVRYRRKWPYISITGRRRQSPLI